MKLSKDKIIELIESGTSDDMKMARKKAKHRNMHVTGEGVVEFLEDLDSYETEAQKLLREKLAKSNRSTFAFIKRPCDKIFTAKGGAINYNLPQDKIDYLKSNLSTIADGLDIKKYLKKKVMKEYIVDPNGVLFVDISPEGKLETYVIPTKKIMWREAKGNTVEAIIFEPYEKPEDKFKINEKGEKVSNILATVSNIEIKAEKLYYRVIDEDTDRIFIREKRVRQGETNYTYDIYEEPGSNIDNYFGFVPALILGDEKCNNTDLFESIIEDLLEDADEALRDISVKTVHKLSHAYPRYWSYAQACTQCNGEGTVDYVTKQATDTTDAVIESRTCSSCGGDGAKKRTNPSDEVVVPVPQGDDPILQKLMGFESPDLETARFYEDLVEKSCEKMFKAMWGTTYESGGKRETATGRYLDAHPVVDRLGDISDTFAKMHKFLLDCYGIVLLRKRNYESSVTYGRRYLFDGPDAILVKYQEVSRENISEVTKMDLAVRYIDAEYQYDAIERVKKKKLLKVEPFPMISCEKIMMMPALPDNEKLKKLYFSEWSNTLKDSELIFSTEEQLKSSLNNFIQSKTLENVEKTE